MRIARSQDEFTRRTETGERRRENGNGRTEAGEDKFQSPLFSLRFPYLMVPAVYKVFYFGRPLFRRFGFVKSRPGNRFFEGNGKGFITLPEQFIW